MQIHGTVNEQGLREYPETVILGCGARNVAVVTSSHKADMEENVPFFPDPPAITVERTLAIIKPDAIDCAEEIIEEIKQSGFTILQV